MVERLSELNKICQKPRYREVGNWMVRHILRDAALPITWLLLHTPVTAHQVTLAALLIGTLGCFFLSVPGNGFFLAGALLIQLWYLLDHVDGQIARYRKTSSLTGRYFDFLMHHWIHALFPLALGVHSFILGGSVFYLFWGFVSALSILFFNLIHDIKAKAFCEYIQGSGGVSAVRGLPQLDDAPASGMEKVQTGLKRRVFSLLHKSVEAHVMMNVFTLCAAAGFFFKGELIRQALLFYYGLVMPFLAVLKNIYIIRFGKVDSEFRETYKTEPPCKES